MRYAQELARNALERRQEALFTDMLPERLTVEQLAREDDVSPIAIHQAIQHARIELFGKDLSDNAIAYRLRTRPPIPPICAEADCDTPLPPGVHRARRYCTSHSTPAARTRRHRRGLSSTV